MFIKLCHLEKIRLNCITVFILLTAIASVAIGKDRQMVLTSEDQSWLKAHPNIVIGYTDTFEPEVIVDADGVCRGLLVDILDELNKRLGTNIGLRIDTVKNIIERAKDNKVDGILSLHPEHADKLGMLKTEGYISSYPAVFSRKNDSFDHPVDFLGKRIAIIDQAYFSEKIVNQYEGKVTVIKVKDALEGLQSVNPGSPG